MHFKWVYFIATCKLCNNKAVLKISPGSGKGVSTNFRKQFSTILNLVGKILRIINNGERIIDLYSYNIFPRCPINSQINSLAKLFNNYLSSN